MEAWHRSLGEEHLGRGAAAASLEALDAVLAVGDKWDIVVMPTPSTLLLFEANIFHFFVHTCPLELARAGTAWARGRGCLPRIA